MNIEELQKNWNELGRSNPLWAILACDGKKGNKWNTEEFFAHGRTEIAGIVSPIESLGIKIPRKRALDFGCGVGRLTQALADYFGEVCGIDIALSMIELARKYNRYGDRCKYYVNSSDQFHLYPDDSFDLNSIQTSHCNILPPAIRRTEEEFLRLLTPQGLLVFQLPSEQADAQATSQSDRSERH